MKLFFFILGLLHFTDLSETQTTSSTPNSIPHPPHPDYSKKPGTEWPGNYDGGKRHIFADWLLNGIWDQQKHAAHNGIFEYPGYDGWYNNLARPDAGAIDRPLLRRWPAAYKDGSYLPSGYNRPNPIELSEKLLRGPIGKQSKNGRNALLVFFGQQVVEEILDAQRPACPPEYFNIDIPANHKYRENPRHSQMPLLRTRYDMHTGYSPNNPRQQLNEITPFIDGGLFYGISKQWSDQLRTYRNGTFDQYGRLAFSHDGLFPEINTGRLPMANPPPPFYHAHYVKTHETARVERFFKLGNPRGNENAFLLTFGVMWFRWHNHLAERIRFHNPDWSGEKIYNEARKWVIATQQRLYVYDWLPKFVGEDLPKYYKYDASIDPQIDQFFQSAAFRFGHTLVVPGVYLRGYIREQCPIYFKNWKKKAIRTCNIFWRPQEPMLNKTDDNSSLIDIDRILMGMSVQLSEQEDHVIVEDLRQNVFGPLEFPRRDLMAINIQRGRDHGLPDFNSARKAFGLSPYESFDDFKYINITIKDELKSLYKDINNIDVWVGGILETDNGPGELFQTIILDQFKRIRDADRFWYENKHNGLFTKDEIERINQITVYDIIMAVTKMDAMDIPRNPFKAPISEYDQNLIKECKLKNSGNYFHLPQLDDSLLDEPCSQPDSYDYFYNSEASFILSFAFVVAFVFGAVGLVYYLIKSNEKDKMEMLIEENARKSTILSKKSVDWPMFIVTEWIGPKNRTREVVLSFLRLEKKLCIKCFNGIILRALDFSNNETTVVRVYLIGDKNALVLNTPHNYDLVILFESQSLKENFMTEFDNHFVNTQTVQKETLQLSWNSALRIIITKDERQKRLEMFFRVVFAQAFQINHSNHEILKVGAFVAREVVNTELTISEFADSLSMVPTNEFVKRIFALADKDKNGFISFREFVDLLIIFAEGTEERKAKLLFDMYDIDGIGELKREDFVDMIKSFLETVGGKVDDKDIRKTMNLMLKNAGVEHKMQFTFGDFKKIIGDDILNLNTAKLGFKGVKGSENSYLAKARHTIENIYESRQDIEARFEGKGKKTPDIEVRQNSKMIDERQEEMIRVQKNIPISDKKSSATLKFIELRSKEIFLKTIYTLVLLAIFSERAYYYSVEREHSGLRQIAGYGVTITRGAASAMMFTYSSLLVTMCRNTNTFLRETFLNNYVPFDAFLDFHKYIACWAFVFTTLHIVGHAFNFYHISTQTSDDLTCLFRNYFHATHEIPKFHYWLWQTMTGITGVILTVIWILMYAFALPIIRRNIYNWFWYTHNLYPLFFIFMILHGSGRLIQPPFTYYFLLGPVILFTLDSIVSIRRKKIEIPVMRACVLPSNVTMLEFRKPENFQYRAGQWVRLACIGLNKHEYHPFTLTSAPDEYNLTVHIRAVGPWTKLVRRMYETASQSNSKLPKLYLDGPYGEGHQDWNTYDVAIMIGGGIGVTPFASIIKDVTNKINRTRSNCKKVYFIWTSRTQKQFEWLVDMIRDVENVDKNNFISCHIFITQFYEKFDLRTILLYICERHYQRIENKSMFTNLRAVTHFGRPDFSQFFKTVQYIHESSKRIGVFSCGPPSMTSAVDNACSKINRQCEQKFEHHFKNF